MLRPSLHRVNDILFSLIVIVTLYIISAPFVPQLSYWWQSRNGHKAAVLQQVATVAANSRPGNAASAQNTSQPNRLIVPTMLFDQAIHEGSIKDRYKILDQGVWRYPTSSTPDAGGNTVMLAHRFTYTNPRGAFYFLNKLTVGDTIGIMWRSRLYTYQVSSTNVVDANDSAIQAPTSDARLTLFTCTPLLHPTQRLVVVAKLVRQS